MTRDEISILRFEGVRSLSGGRHFTVYMKIKKSPSSIDAIDEGAKLPGEDLNPQSKIQSLVCYQLHHRETIHFKPATTVTSRAKLSFFFSRVKNLVNQRQRDTKGCAPIQFAGNEESAVMSFDYAFHDRHAQTRTPLIGVGEEGIEDLLLDAEVHPDSRVCDFDLDSLIRFERFDGKLTSLRHGFTGIVGEIEKDSEHPLLIHDHGFGDRYFRSYGNIPGLELFLHRFQEPFEKAVEVHDGHVQTNLTPGIIEQLAGDLIQPIRLGNNFLCVSLDLLPFRAVENDHLRHTAKYGEGVADIVQDQRGKLAEGRQPVLEKQLLLGLPKGLIRFFQFPGSFPEVVHEVIVALPHHIGYGFQDRDCDLGIVPDNGVEIISADVEQACRFLGQNRGAAGKLVDQSHLPEQVSLLVHRQQIFLRKFIVFPNLHGSVGDNIEAVRLRALLENNVPRVVLDLVADLLDLPDLLIRKLLKKIDLF